MAQKIGVTTIMIKIELIQFRGSEITDEVGSNTENKLVIIIFTLRWGLNRGVDFRPGLGIERLIDRRTELLCTIGGLMRRRLKIRIMTEEIFEEYKSAFGDLILTKLCYYLTNSCSRSTRYVAIGRFKRPLLTISAIWG